MAGGKTADFLVEIGTEELPPKALRKLMQAFAANLGRLLDEHRLSHGKIKEYSSPRRLAALVSNLAMAQEDRQVDAKGPPVSIAFDDGGGARPPATPIGGMPNKIESKRPSDSPESRAMMSKIRASRTPRSVHNAEQIGLTSIATTSWPRS